eukprot:COSAG02_NODE_4792_length_4974_cov_10.374769_2_plen_176_part_00
MAKPRLPHPVQCNARKVVARLSIRPVRPVPHDHGRRALLCQRRRQTLSESVWRRAQYDTWSPGSVRFRAAKCEVSGFTQGIRALCPVSRQDREGIGPSSAGPGSVSEEESGDEEDLEDEGFVRFFAMWCLNRSIPLKRRPVKCSGLSSISLTCQICRWVTVAGTCQQNFVSRRGS